MSSSRSNPVEGRRIVVGVGGGIAAYKAAELVRALVKRGALVQAVMTDAARQFIGEVTLQALTGRPVFTDLWDLGQESEIGHIQAADGAELVIVAPATANLLARLSSGRASDALSAVLLATRAPVLLAPSMNVNMWNHPSTRANLERLRERPGIHIVGPGVGFLACRWEGPGRLAEPADILEAAEQTLTPQHLAGRRVVVTAGPTREALDPVRFISNRSSGRMGFEIARAARRQGAAVELIAGPVAIQPPAGVEVTSVTSALEMRDATRAAAIDADAVIMVAAVADLRPAAVAEQKIKKGGRADTSSLELVKNPDILAELGLERAEKGSSRPVLVGFAAETENVLEHARRKRVQKAVDLIVANDVSAPGTGFGSENNTVTLIEADSEISLDVQSKAEIAHQLCERVALRLAEG